MLSRRRNRATQRGSLFIIAVVSIAVTLTIALAIMDNANATFMQGYRQPKLLALQTLADGGAQYGYWKYRKQNITLPYTETGHAMGKGTFDVTLTDNSGNINGTFKVVATSHIHSDSYSITRVYSSGAIPSPPANLTATGGSNSITLTWTASTGATSYNVYRGTSAGGESSIAIATGITGTTYVDTTVSAGVTYYYYVTAVGSGGESGASSEASAATSSAPTMNVTFSNTVPSVNLTTEGTLDWSEWGYDPRDSKSTGGLISNITYTGTSPQAYTSTTAYSWTDGNPTTTVTNTNATYYLNNTGASFTVTLPTYSTTHTARVYAAEDNCDAEFNVTMSGTALTYDDTSNLDTSKGHGGHIDGIYTITYQGNAGGTLTIVFSIKKHHGAPSASQISLQAITLS
jgi:hypothetical protein